MVEPWIIQTLASIIGGGLAGGVLTICYNWLISNQNSTAKEKGAIAALEGEIRQCKTLCDFNSQANLGTNVAFAHFPSTVAMDVTFAGRHMYPRLATIHSDLENYSMDLVRVNQLIDLHNLMWISPEQPFASGFRGKLAKQIVELCKGSRSNGVMFENTSPLPSLIDLTLEKVEKLYS